MNDQKLRRIALAAMFTALTTVATLLIRISTVAGYTNLGDGIVLLGGIFLGPGLGFAAGGLGSAMADLLAGYAYYIPGTFLIKGGCASIAVLILNRIWKREKSPSVWQMVLSTLPAELFMAAGYFLYKALILGKPESAAASIPNNLAQGAVGMIVCTLLFCLLYKITEIRKRVWKGR